MKTFHGTIFWTSGKTSATIFTIRKSRTISGFADDLCIDQNRKMKTFHLKHLLCKQSQFDYHHLRFESNLSSILSTITIKHLELKPWFPTNLSSCWASWLIFWLSFGILSKVQFFFIIFGARAVPFSFLAHFSLHSIRGKPGSPQLRFSILCFNIFTRIWVDNFSGTRT